MSLITKKVEISSANFSNDTPTAIIICNGPSLADVPNEWLDKYTTFGSNRVFLKYNPTYLAIMDLKMVHTPQLAEEAASNFDKSEEVFLSDVSADHFEDLSDNVFVLTWKTMIDDDGRWVKAFSKDPARMVISGGTVTYVLLQLAIWKGFRRLLCVGLDHNFEGPGGDHFTTDYNKDVGIPYEGNPVGRYGAGAWYWDSRGFYEKTEFYYEHANFVVSKQYNGEIINCTPNTKLDAFTVADWRDY